jgi:hypothetical protein
MGPATKPMRADMPGTDGRPEVCGRAGSAPALDALPDLQKDPLDLNDLIGGNPEGDKCLAQATRMKVLLIEWLTRVMPPHLASVRERRKTLQPKQPIAAGGTAAPTRVAHCHHPAAGARSGICR